ncbi:juvenile hormone esterase-like [Uranotaenia lowii]|uniref:juvenile hormone esterase-like n=1 Tax=Uranotaenia lowii TaxID=190385 RepID=UPI002478562A|nr:juvenile hormone esterase-like [Uranotaenia lowii]XP_055614177.1 juvenile hormone esterase-like [Uranotaenia lowii]
MSVWVWFLLSTFSIVSFGQNWTSDQCDLSCFESGPAVLIEDGCICGTTMPGLYGSSSFDAFLGIPFAKPPVGELRFANPVPNDPFEGVYNASVAKDMCLQRNDITPWAVLEGEEDCLYLNVYRPKNVRGLLPVMVFIHGGGFVGGSALPELIGPEKFMDTRKVIFVAMQYRLGVLGFLSTNDKHAAGNFGFKDQIMALRWVRKNIGQFGGDPSRITLFGQSSGASSVQLIMISPLGEGLFSKAIIQSGSGLSHWSLTSGNPLELARKQAAVLGIESVSNMSSEELVQKLRGVDAGELVNSIQKLKYWYKHPIVLYSAVVEQQEDEWSFLLEDPRKLWAAGKYVQIPWMTGYLPEEGAVMSLQILPNKTMLTEFITNQKTLVPMIASASPEILPFLNERFFEGKPIDITTANGLTKMISESAFLYPMILSVLQHQKNANLQTAPVSMYHFNFRGRFSVAPFYTGLPPTVDYGIVHADELPYLFRIPANLPDFPPDSSEAAMSREVVNHWVQFALNGGTTEGPQKIFFNCKREPLGCLPTIEFRNSNQTERGIEVVELGASDESIQSLREMYNWWSKRNF